MDISADDNSPVPLITIQYGPEGMLQFTGAQLSERLVSEYEKLAAVKENKSLIVDVQANTAGSPLIRALVNVHKHVLARKGQLICAGYPKDFLPSLHALGLTSLPGFRLALNREDALRSAENKVVRL